MHPQWVGELCAKGYGQGGSGTKHTYQCARINSRNVCHTFLLEGSVKPPCQTPQTSDSTVVGILDKGPAGIDIIVFKAHSVRGASTSAAMDKGVSLSDTLNTADWNRDATFKRFYYPPSTKDTFATNALRKTSS